MAAGVSQTPDAVFAANRSVGRIALTVGHAHGATRRTRVHEAGSLRVRFPNPVADELEAVIVNTAGGIAGGDRSEIDLTVTENARLVLTTAAAEKVYRTHGPDAVAAVRLAVAAGGELAWLPQETILFDRAQLSRSIDVEVEEGARLLLAEAVVFGRSAMGETVAQGRFIDRWRVRRGGRLIYAETVRLDGAVAERLAAIAVASGQVALATVLIVPGEAAAVEAVRALAERCRGEIGISAWNGLAVARLVAPDGAALRHDLAAVLAALRGRALPRIWLN